MYKWIILKQLGIIVSRRDRPFGTVGHAETRNINLKHKRVQNAQDEDKEQR